MSELPGDMFADLMPPKPPRAKPRKLMQVWDAGNANCGWTEEGEQWVMYKCPRCDHESEWMAMPNITAAKRGIPCPKCNVTN